MVVSATKESVRLCADGEVADVRSAEPPVTTAVLVGSYVRRLGLGPDVYAWYFNAQRQCRVFGHFELYQQHETRISRNQYSICRGWGLGGGGGGGGLTPHSLMTTPHWCDCKAWLEGTDLTPQNGPKSKFVLLYKTSSEDSSFLLLLAYQRIRGFAFMRYINPRLID